MSKSSGQMYVHLWNTVLYKYLKKSNIFLQNADIGLGAVGVMLEREKVVDFTYPFYEGAGQHILGMKRYIPTSLFK